MTTETEWDEASHWWIKEPMWLRVVDHVDEESGAPIADTITVQFSDPNGPFGSLITLDSAGYGSFSKLSSITTNMVANTKYTATFQGGSLFRQITKTAKVRGAK